MINQQVGRLPLRIRIGQITKRNCSNENGNEKFRQLIKDGPSLGDFIRSGDAVKQLRLKREDEEPR